jgi:hypothetical protein
LLFPRLSRWRGSRPSSTKLGRSWPRSRIRWRRIIAVVAIITAPTRIPSTSISIIIRPSGLSRVPERRIVLVARPPFVCGRDDPEEHAKEDDEEDEGGPAGGGVVVVAAGRGRGGARKLGVLVVALGRQGEAVLDAAGAAEDVVVGGGAVAFTDDVGRGELYRVWEGSSASPLNVLLGVRRPRVVAAHDVEVTGDGAQTGSRDAFELRRGGDAAVGCDGAVAAEGEGADLGEEDRVFVRCSAHGDYGGGGG